MLYTGRSLTNTTMGGSQSSKSTISKTSIPDEDLRFLLKNTKFDTKTIKQWYKTFMKDTPSGRMDQEAFLDTYKSLLDTGSADDYCKHVFRAFDKDKSGFIEFREFLFAVYLWSHGSPDQKLEWSFQVYDIDSNGKLDQSEVQQIIKATCDLMDNPSDPQQTGEIADAVFASLDVDHDGFITKGEFIRGCKGNSQILQMLSPSGI